ncbi:hypothetical protein [Gynuella sunshinyii]|nr:hypothetical protein [Gynuella sunshinyii]
MWYHILGWTSSMLFVLTWYGLGQQLLSIEKRRRNGQIATQSLSINQFASSYFAFYANFFYGISIEPFNHYLVWTRCGALLLLLVILFRIWVERRSWWSAITFWSGLTILVLGFVSMLFRPFPGFARLGANSLMLAVTVLLVQGTLHQWLLIRKQGAVGALSFSLFRTILIKDISTLTFALTIPLTAAWPLLLLNGSSVLSRGLLLIQMEVLRKRTDSQVAG